MIHRNAIYRGLLNKLFPAAAIAAAALTLTACGGGAEAAPAYTTDETCVQLFGTGDEGRLFRSVAFIKDLPEKVEAKHIASAKDFVTELAYVSNTANGDMKPLVEDMIKPLQDLAGATEGSDVGKSDAFSAASDGVLEKCSTHTVAYEEGKVKKVEQAKAAEAAAAKKAEDEAAAKAAAEAAAAKKAEEEAAAAAPKDYSGVGDDVITITKHATGAQAAIINHSGGGNFAVHTLDGAMEENDLLVNEIGNYSGTVLFDHDGRGESTSLKISAGGAWTVRLVPVSSLASHDGSAPMTGYGDSVFRYTGPAKAATFTHDGSSNIAVHNYSGGDGDLLINEIGVYSGTIVWAPGLYTVSADGNWSATLK